MLEFKPVYYEDRVGVINPYGHSGIVTLWTKLDGKGGYREKLREAFPQMFEPISPLVAITNLYGNGLPQMLVNLLYNPQVERIAITGSDATGSAEALTNFFERGVEQSRIGGVDMAKIIGTEFPLDPQLSPNLFLYKPEIKQFKASDLEGVVKYVSCERTRNLSEEDRVKIELSQPKFTDYPSDISQHRIYSDSILEAWMDILFHINRYGRNIPLDKGMRRTLFNLDVTINNPELNPEEKLRRYNFDPDEIREYQKSLLDGNLPSDRTYSYGSRMRTYWGIDALEKIAERLRRDPLDRHCLVSLWDTGKDLISQRGDSSSPCFSDAYFVNNGGRLMMSIGFRTHNAVSAWLINVYGLRAIQEFVSQQSGLPTGQLNIRSRWISIDPENAKTISVLELAEKNRNIKLDVNDPRGYFEITVDNDAGEIVAQHYSNQNILLEEIRGKTKGDVKNKVRQLDAFSTTDHAVWFGMRLEEISRRLKGE